MEVRPVRRRDQGDVMCRGLQPRARVAVHVGVQYEVTEIVVLMIMMYITISAISAKLEKNDDVEKGRRSQSQCLLWFPHHVLSARAVSKVEIS